MGSFPLEWNYVFIMIMNMNGCILIIYTLTLSANIAHSNELVRAQVIWLLLQRIESLIICSQPPPYLHNFLASDLTDNKAFTSKFWKLTVITSVTVSVQCRLIKAFKLFIKTEKGNREVIADAPKPCGYLNFALNVL